MAKLLFKLNGVPDQEAESIRALLDENNINFYETSSGMWGLSFAGIWLPDETQYLEAKQLLDTFHQDFYQNAVGERLKQQQNGEQISWFKSLLKHPIKTVAVILFVGAVLYFSITPFFFTQL